MFSLLDIYSTVAASLLTVGICGMFKYEMKITFIWQPILFCIFWPLCVPVLIFSELGRYFVQEKGNGY